MKAKIIKSSAPFYWYNNLVGEVFQVESHNETEIAVYYRDGLWLIKPGDAELIEERSVKPEPSVPVSVLKKLRDEILDDYYKNNGGEIMNMINEVIKDYDKK